jgi:hypothetical protein
MLSCIFTRRFASRIAKQRQRTGWLGVSKWRMIPLFEDEKVEGIYNEPTNHLSSRVSKASKTSESDSNVSEFIKRVFLPVGYPSSVRDSYTRYIGLNMGQVMFISLSRVLSTQAMLLAVGLGQGGALPMAAVMNWLLKDGLGHLGSILVGTSINTKFDSDPKRYKFMSMSLGQLANFLGIMSLAKPGMFLVLTSLSSALSRVGTLAFTSSRARIYENFSAAGNLGDLMRCSQAQSTIATIAGTAIGIAVSPIVGSDVSSIMALFVPVSAATHYLAYRAVGTLELRTINVQRMEIIIKTYMQEGRVPTPSEVASEESFVHWKPIYDIEINPPVSRDLFSNNTRAITDLAQKKFLIERKELAKTVSLFMKDDASPEQTVRGMFEAITGRGDDVVWKNFHEKLILSKWDLSVAFIDDVSQRVSIESI